jgi:hypothetical protein
VAVFEPRTTRRKSFLRQDMLCAVRLSSRPKPLSQSDLVAARAKAAPMNPAFLTIDYHGDFQPEALSTLPVTPLASSEAR